MSYIKLVNFELKRFMKLFIALVVVVTTMQLIDTVSSAWSYLDNAETVMKQEKISEIEYVETYSSYSMTSLLDKDLFQLAIVFAAVMLMLYVFFIWYRDWLGKSSFIYRLLMLPTARIQIYFAKLTTILLLILALLGVQVILIDVAEFMVKAILPEVYFNDLSRQSIYSNNFTEVLMPQSLLEFFLSYGTGIALVATIFTAILFERSYHLKGIILAGIYIALSLAVLFMPIIIEMNTDYFYLNEILWMFVLTQLIVFTSAFLVANYLLKRKIQV